MVGAEEEEVAKMGCPSLGEHTQVEVIIEESYEFKVSVFGCVFVFVCMRAMYASIHFIFSHVHMATINTAALTRRDTTK